MMRALWISLSALGVAVLLLTHLGGWIPLGDAVAVVRPQIIILSIPVVLGVWLSPARRFATVVALGVIASAVSTYLDYHGQWPEEPVASERTYTLYQKNLLWNGRSPSRIAADIEEMNPDFVTLQEMSSRNREALAPVLSTYRYSKTCVSEGNGGIGLFSRFPLTNVPEDCDTASGIVVMQAQLPDGKIINVGSVHLNWPFPYDQAEQVQSVLAGLSALDGPVLLGGDFNMVPWGSSVKRIARAAEGQRLGGYPTTFPAFGWFAPLAIDHVIVNARSGTVETRPRLGSDHLGLFARFAF